MDQQEEVFDITIIGGGPTGLFTAFYAGLRQASVKIIESLPQLGGQLAALYPEKYVYDVAGFPKIRADELVERLTEQMNQFDNEVHLNESVESVEKVDGIFKIQTNGQTHYSKTVIITAGSGAFTPRTMNLENEAFYKDVNLHYHVQDMNYFNEKEVVIFGGGDSAVDWALMLEKTAKKVTLVHRRDKFRAHEHSVKLLEESTVETLTPYVPVSMSGDNRIEKIELKKAREEETVELFADEYLVNYGFVSNLGPINDWGLEIEKDCIVVNSQAETSIEGIYAVGDIAAYKGKVKLMATGFGEAPIAVSRAKVYIDPTEKMETAHSTSIMSRKANKKKKEKVTV